MIIKRIDTRIRVLHSQLMAAVIYSTRFDRITRDLIDWRRVQEFLVSINEYYFEQGSDVWPSFNFLILHGSNKPKQYA